VAVSIRLREVLAFRASIPGLSPGRRPSFLVCSSPLPATLAGDLPPSSQRGFRIRVVTRGISNGFVAAFRHRRSPPDLLLPEPRRLPCGRPLGTLRVFPWSHATPCGVTQASRFPWPSPYTQRLSASGSVSGRSPQFQPASLALNYGCYTADSNQPALLTRLLRPVDRSTERVATSASIFPRPSFAFSLAGGCADAVQEVFPPGSCRHRLCAPVVGRFLSILSS